jgi:NAD(P)-dependent dehydrogenase (short-subunit alcohol dehydrogenase family)
MPDRSLAGRAAVVTGGASGIGRAIALRLAREGADVCLLSLGRERVTLLPGEVKYFASREELEETRRAVESSGVRCLAIEGDVGSPADVERTIRAAVEQFRCLDVLINNAATGCVQNVVGHDDETFRRVLSVNLFGAYLCTKAALPHMIRGGWGRIVSITSTSAHVGAASYSAYTASKHGLLGFTRCLALEVAGQNITANTVSPGIVDTPSAALHLRKWAEQAGASYETTREHWQNEYPQRRFISPEEVADLVSYLCREESRGINGEDIRITTGAMW